MTKRVIEVRDLWKSFYIRHNRNDSLKERFISLFDGRRRERREVFWALKGVNLEATQGEMVGIIGPNGSGKSTLLRIIARILHPTKGSVVVRGSVAPLIEIGVGFHPELTGQPAGVLSLSRFLSSNSNCKASNRVICPRKTFARRLMAWFTFNMFA